MSFPNLNDTIMELQVELGRNPTFKDQLKADPLAAMQAVRTNLGLPPVSEGEALWFAAWLHYAPGQCAILSVPPVCECTMNSQVVFEPLQAALGAATRKEVSDFLLEKWFSSWGA